MIIKRIINKTRPPPCNIIKLYKNLVNLDDLKYTGKRLTKDSEWIFIDGLGDEL